MREAKYPARSERLRIFFNQFKIKNVDAAKKIGLNRAAFISQLLNKNATLTADMAKQLIREGEGKGELVFLSMPDQTVNLHLKDVAKIAGISKHLTTHVGRHTFAFLYLLMGGKVEELREILGHSKLETTLIYTHTDHDKKVAGMLKFDEILRVK